MRTHQIEEWALRAVERAEKHQPNEDDRVELKANWIDHVKDCPADRGPCKPDAGRADLVVDWC
jgi:hypothetical protein